MVFSTCYVQVFCIFSDTPVWCVFIRYSIRQQRLNSYNLLSLAFLHYEVLCSSNMKATPRWCCNCTVFSIICSQTIRELDCVWNVLAHAQKPDFVFRRNGRFHLNRQGRQFSLLLAAEVCASAVVMLDTPRYEVVWEYWLPTPFAGFPFTSPPVRHRVPSGFKRTLPHVL
jgi:hypothetical protein